jgi:uncharacterized protein YkwD
MSFAISAKRRSRLALLTTTTALAGLATAVQADAAQACSNAPTPAAVRCHVNVQRAAHGLPAMRPAAALRRAALRHARDMVARRYFSHVSPSGGTMSRRVRSAGYLSRAGSFSLGENIAWGQGSRGTPAAIVRAWMNSPGHRAVILNRAFREIGIGITKGVPAGGLGATYVMNAGARS